MNNRNVFQAFTQASPGIDTSKCLALVTAAYDGNTEEVVRLASDPQVDINFLAYFPKPKKPQPYEYDEYHSALSAALENKHDQIVLFLLQLGAKIDMPASGHYRYTPCFKTVLSIACINRKPGSEEGVNLSLFKHILRATKVLNHDFSGYCGQGSLVQVLLEKGSIAAAYPNSNERLGLIFHEAVLKNETKVIDEFLKHTKSIKFDDASCQAYLIDIDLATEQALRARKGLDYLAEINFITKELSHKIKAIIAAKTKFSLEINEFPIELQQSVAMQSNRTLRELFAEFQHWILPDEGLPSGLADSKMVKTMDLTDDELKRICSFQDPKRLRQYMEIDPSEFLTMVYDAISPQGENPAAILLAQLLMFHKNVLLDDKKPLFNETQEQNCFLVLKRLYSLSDAEKLTLISHRKHGEDVRELRYENADLQQQVDVGKAKIESLEAKVNQLVALVQSMQAQLTQSEQQDKQGMKRSHSPTFRF